MVEKDALIRPHQITLKQVISLGLRYRFDVLDALKRKGWNTGRLRAENIAARERGEKAPGISEGSIQSLRDSRPVSWATIEIICDKLDCQPGDFLEFVKENPPHEGED